MNIADQSAIQRGGLLSTVQQDLCQEVIATDSHPESCGGKEIHLYLLQ